MSDRVTSARQTRRRPVRCFGAPSAEEIGDYVAALIDRNDRVVTHWIEPKKI